MTSQLFLFANFQRSALHQPESHFAMANINTTSEHQTQPLHEFLHDNCLEANMWARIDSMEIAVHSITLDRTDSLHIIPCSDSSIDSASLACSSHS